MGARSVPIGPVLKLKAQSKDTGKTPQRRWPCLLGKKCDQWILLSGNEGPREEAGKGGGGGSPPKLFPKQSGEHGCLAEPRLPNRLQACRLAENSAFEQFEP